jgi:hypothetical protein
MSQLVADCPRCGAKRMTLDVFSAVVTDTVAEWQHHWEAFCVCRHCTRTTVFKLRLTQYQHKDLGRVPGGLVGVQGAINQFVNVDGYISLKDAATAPPPEHLPNHVLAAFKEGAKCMAVGCFNAGGTMFRLCLDRATKSLLPAEDVNGLNNKIRRSLGFRMTWLLDNNLLPRALEDLAACVKEDGNDGAHEGTLSKGDAEDLLDFTVAVLERLYTEPERLRLAAARRAERRQGA